VAIDPIVSIQPQGRQHVYFFRPSLNQPYSSTITDYHLVLGAGADLAVVTHSRIWIGPTFRFHYVFDQDERPGGPPLRGISPMVMFVGGRIAFHF
jgi:hypothetical protein